MLYVLDLDDTLYLECDYVKSGFENIDKWMKNKKSVRRFFEIAWGYFECGERGSIFDLTLEDLNIFDEKLVKHLIDIYRNHIPNIKLQNDSKEFLESNNPENMVLITDGNKQSQRNKIEALSIKKYFSKIIVTDEWGKDYWKPNVRSYKEAQSSRRPDECVYIGDNPKKDFVGPEKLRWLPSIRINRDKSIHNLVVTPVNCHEIKSFSEGLPY